MFSQRTLWQSGRPELPVAGTTTGAKRVLNRRDGFTYARRDRAIAGVQLPFGVRVLLRDLGMYRVSGAYAVTGGRFDHESKAHKRVYDTVDEALAAAFERVKFAEDLYNATAARFPAGTEVLFRAQPKGYGSRYEQVRGTVVAVNTRRYGEQSYPGYIVVNYNGREYDLRAANLEVAAE